MSNNKRRRMSTRGEMLVKLALNNRMARGKKERRPLTSIENACDDFYEEEKEYAPEEAKRIEGPLLEDEIQPLDWQEVQRALFITVPAAADAFNILELCNESPSSVCNIGSARKRSFEEVKEISSQPTFSEELCNESPSSVCSIGSLRKISFEEVQEICSQPICSEEFCNESPSSVCSTGSPRKRSFEEVLEICSQPIGSEELCSESPSSVCSIGSLRKMSFEEVQKICSQPICSEEFCNESPSSVCSTGSPRKRSFEEVQEICSQPIGSEELCNESLSSVCSTGSPRKRSFEAVQEICSQPIGSEELCSERPSSVCSIGSLRKMSFEEVQKICSQPIGSEELCNESPSSVCSTGSPRKRSFEEVQEICSQPIGSEELCNESPSSVCSTGSPRKRSFEAVQEICSQPIGSEELCSERPSSVCSIGSLRKMSFEEVQKICSQPIGSEELCNESPSSVCSTGSPRKRSFEEVQEICSQPIGSEELCNESPSSVCSTGSPRKRSFEEVQEICSKPIGSEVKKAKTRRYDRENFCVFCKKLVKKLRRHFMNNHKDELIIAEYIALWERCPKESKERRKKIIADLTLQGNKEYNDACLKNPGSTTSLLPVKRPPVEKANKTLVYVSCLVCQGLFVKRHFYQHAAVCSKKFKEEEELLKAEHDKDEINNQSEEDVELFEKRRTTYLKTYGVNMVYCDASVSKKFKEEILTSLRMDDIGKIAVQDQLLVSVASDFHHSHQCAKDKPQVTKKLRDGAKLLKKIQEYDDSVKELKDIFTPNKVETVITACQTLCKIEDIKTAINDPTNVTVGMSGRLSWILEESGKKLMDQIYCDEALTEDQKHRSRRSVKVFMEMMRRRWKYFISTNLENIRRRGKMVKPFILPLDDDIKQFASMLRTMEHDLQTKLSNQITIADYEMLCKVTICHILTLNRRRPFEATNSEIDFFLKRKSSNEYYPNDVLESLAEEERVSLNELSSYVVPAKGTEAIATILMTKSMESSIELIIKCRDHFNLSESLYLFPRPGLTTLFDGSKVMRELVSLCPGLKKPEFLTANGLRHNVATKGHVKGPTFTHKLSKFMCHTQQVHDKNYVAQVSLINKGVIGNYLANLEGTNLGNRYETSTTNNSHSEAECRHIDGVTVPAMQSSIFELNHNQQNQSTTFLHEDERCDPIYEPDDDEDDEEYLLSPRNKTKKSNASVKRKHKWTYEEKKLVAEYFSEFLQKRISPGTTRCRQFVEKFKDKLSGRTAVQVYTFIHNILSNKIKLPQGLFNVN